LIVGSAVMLFIGLSSRREKPAFVGSNLLLAGMLVTGGAASFPVMLYSTLDPHYSLTVYDVAADSSSLRVAFLWWPVALVLVFGCSLFISRRYAEKLSVKSAVS